ncbi:MAG: Rrf2 family transcriptional regulator [Ideonella sp.]|nr:Rrf2 family transcriptional regulator [Ideonella sp.]MCC7458266.1 Rrf2 family transcriptional regulator [Nitrospira sp.]
MKLQKNTLLALYSVLEFAAEPTRHIAAAAIAEKYGVSQHHLAKVLSELAHAGIVESVRGVGGGYRFTGNVRRLTLMDVITLFEEPLQGDGIGTDATPVDRALGAVLAEIDQIAAATFKSITLATMLQMVGKHAQPATQRAAPAAAPAAR